MHNKKRKRAFKPGLWLADHRGKYHQPAAHLPKRQPTGRCIIVQPAQKQQPPPQQQIGDFEAEIPAP